MRGKQSQVKAPAILSLSSPPYADVNRQSVCGIIAIKKQVIVLNLFDKTNNKYAETIELNKYQEPVNDEERIEPLKKAIHVDNWAIPGRINLR